APDPQRLTGVAGRTPTLAFIPQDPAQRAARPPDRPPGRPAPDVPPRAAGPPAQGPQGDRGALRAPDAWRDPHEPGAREGHVRLTRAEGPRPRRLPDAEGEPALLHCGPQRRLRAHHLGG